MNEKIDNIVVKISLLNDWILRGFNHAYVRASAANRKMFIGIESKEDLLKERDNQISILYRLTTGKDETKKHNNTEE